MRVQYPILFLISVSLLSSLGCVAPPPRVETEVLIEQAVDVDVAVEYRTAGEPVDAADPPVETLTPVDAIRLAMAHSPEIQVTLARVRVALAEARQARLLANPILSVVVRFPEGGGSPTVEAGLAADLLSLVQRPRQASAADHRLRATSAEALTTATDVLLEVRERYIAVQALDAELEILEQRRSLVERLLELARSRLEAGESSRIEVLSLDAERAQVETEVLETRAEQTDERLALARLIGRPSDVADWKVSPWQAPPVPSPDEAAWVRTALSHHPAIQSAHWELAALGDEAALARWSVLQGAEIGIDAEREEGDWSAGPGASAPLPLFDWGQANRERLDARQVEARHKLVQAQRQVVEDVRRALAAVTMARQSLEIVNHDLIPALERQHAQADAAYRAGEAGIITVLLAERELQVGRQKKIDLERRLATSHARLLRAVGGPGIASTLAPTTAPSTQPIIPNSELPID